MLAQIICKINIIHCVNWCEKGAEKINFCCFSSQNVNNAGVVLYDTHLCDEHRHIKSRVQTGMISPQEREQTLPFSFLFLLFVLITCEKFCFYFILGWHKIKTIRAHLWTQPHCTCCTLLISLWKLLCLLLCYLTSHLGSRLTWWWISPSGQRHSSSPSTPYSKSLMHFLYPL